MARKLVVRRGRKVGAPPGTLVYIGQKYLQETPVRVLEYDEDSVSDTTLTSPVELSHYKTNGKVSWLNFDSVHQPDVIESVGKAFGLHPLVLEDILNTDQRPKVEDYEGYLYIVVRMLRFDAEHKQIQSEQLSLILADNLVLSLQEMPGDVFDGVRERLNAGRRIRFMKADYLAYALLDAVVDHYFTLLEQLGDQIEDLEDQLMDSQDPTTLDRIHHFKREMLMLRRAVWPLREVLSKLSRDESALISAETRLFLRDVYDHVIHVIDTVDTLRELLTSMLDLYMSSVSNRMNEVMKVLTIFATLFMPLTFIAGVYGMNFEVMPELQWRYGYPAVLISMLVVVLALWAFFRRKRWL